MAKIGDLILPLRRSSSTCWSLSRLEKLLVITLLLIVLLCISLLITVISYMCTNEANSINLKNSKVCLNNECIELAAKILNQIDENVNPCDDFYTFVCGGDETPFRVIPEDRSNLWAASMLQINIDQKLKAFIENISEIEEDNYLAMIKVFFEQCMDQETIESLGSEPLEIILEHIGGWPVVDGLNWTDTSSSLTERLIKLKEMGLHYDAFAELQVHPHVIDEEYNAIYLGLPLLVLGDRGYYDKSINDTILNAYLDFMIDACVTLGASPAMAKSEMLRVLQFEISLTKIMPRRDIKENIFHPRNFSELQTMAPMLNWTQYLTTVAAPYTKFPADYLIIVEYPNYIGNLSALIENTDSRVLANYIGWRVVSEMIALMDTKWGVMSRKLGRHLDGRLRLLPRWKFCIKLAKDYFDIGVSSLYVKNAPQARKRVNLVKSMVTYIRNAFMETIKTSVWMDSATMAAAINKTKAMRVFIGFPNELLNDTAINNYYELLEIHSNSTFFINTLRIRRWKMDINFLKLNRRNTKWNWQTYGNVIDVNAYYRMQENSIQFPLTIIEALSVSERKPMYLNFGSIGWVIGHEITHGFDDSGRLFDANGQQIDWWTNKTLNEFTRKTQCFIDQYSNYTSPATGMKINGLLTLGENIADNGGIKQAYRAYIKFVTENGADQMLPGIKYNPIQLFFIQSASFYCGKWRKQMLEYIIRTDQHCVNRFRVIGTMSNFDQFSNAFNCDKSAAMNPDKKCELW